MYWPICSLAASIIGMACRDLVSVSRSTETEMYRAEARQFLVGEGEWAESRHVVFAVAGIAEPPTLDKAIEFAQQYREQTKGPGRRLVAFKRPDLSTYATVDEDDEREEEDRA